MKQDTKLPRLGDILYQIGQELPIAARTPQDFGPYKKSLRFWAERYLEHRREIVEFITDWAAVAGAG